jgi:hypothetical protein
MTEFCSYPKIIYFDRVVEIVRERSAYHDVRPPKMLFDGFVKLHGCNTSIVYDWATGDLYAQSRNRIITPQDDQYGFAAWVNKNREALIPSADDIADYEIDEFDKTVIYGEWCGKGIQRGAAISRIERSWFIFDAFNIKDGVRSIADNFWLEPSPAIGLYHIWRYFRTGREKIIVDFSDPEKHEEYFESLTKEIEDQCPVAKEFGVEGIGEGLVFKPRLYNYPVPFRFDDLSFKVKGAKHRIASREYATIQPTNFNQLNAFLDTVCNSVRMEQAIDQTGAPDRKNIGLYLQWLANDILQEEADVIERGEFQKKDVTRGVNERGKTFYFDTLKRKQSGEKR